MSFFKKSIKFISAICPECKGHLELDSNLKTAFCQYCGAQCIVENAPKKENEGGKLETVLNFIERQQALRRQDKQELLRKTEKEEQKRNDHLKKYWWIYTLICIVFFAFILIMAALENQGFI